MKKKINTIISISDEKGMRMRYSAIPRTSRVIIHDGLWEIGSVNNENQLRELLSFLETEIVDKVSTIGNERDGKIEFFTLSKRILNAPYGGFWNIEKLKETTKGNLKKTKGLSNGSIVDCYVEIEDDKVIIHRPNPNAKEAYNCMDIDNQINFRKNNWYL